MEGRIALFCVRSLQASFWNIETNYRNFGLYFACIFLTRTRKQQWKKNIYSFLLSKMHEFNFHHQLLVRICLTKREKFKYEKIVQIIFVVLATERSIKSFTFISLGFCLKSLIQLLRLKNLLMTFGLTLGEHLTMAVLAIVCFVSQLTVRIN